jgi:hypothetical protein
MPLLFCAASKAHDGIDKPSVSDIPSYHHPKGPITTLCVLPPMEENKHPTLIPHPCTPLWVQVGQRNYWGYCRWYRMTFCPLLCSSLSPQKCENSSWSSSFFSDASYPHQQTVPLDGRQNPAGFRKRLWPSHLSKTALTIHTQKQKADSGTPTYSTGTVLLLLCKNRNEETSVEREEEVIWITVQGLSCLGAITTVLCSPLPIWVFSHIPFYNLQQ